MGGGARLRLCGTDRRLDVCAADKGRGADSGRGRGRLGRWARLGLLGQAREWPGSSHSNQSNDKFTAFRAFDLGTADTSKY